MTAPLSIRFDPQVLEQLRRRASRSPGATASGLAQQLVDEGLRQAEFPGIVFKDGASGRRAALALGPDVWEVVRTLREVAERGEAAVDVSAELLTLTPTRVRPALRYFAAHENEINTEIAEADAASAAAEAAWRPEPAQSGMFAGRTRAPAARAGSLPLPLADGGAAALVAPTTCH